MNEANEIKALKKREKWGRRLAWGFVLAPWLVLVALGVAYLLGGDTAVETSAAEPYAIVTATPTAVPPVVIENNNYVQVNPPAVDTAVCAIQAPDLVGQYQLVAVRGVDPATIQSVGYEYMGCDGRIVEQTVCAGEYRSGCAVLVPPVPTWGNLFIVVTTGTSRSHVRVDLSEPYWEFDIGRTVEEILPEEMRHGSND